MRYGKLLMMFIKQSAIQLMAYRMNFWMIFFTHIGYFGVQLLFMGVIFNNVDTIAGWSKYEMFFYIGTYNIIDAIMISAPFFNIMSIPGMVNTGMMDLYIVKPVNTQFLLTCRKVELSAVSSILMGVAILVYALFKMQMTLTLWQVLFYIFTIINGLLIQYSILFILSCLSFWTIKTDFVYKIDLIANYFITKPVDIYKGAVRFILKFILPYGLMFTVCAKSGIKSVTPLEYVVFLAFCWGLFLLSGIFLKISIRHYGSASS